MIPLCDCSHSLRNIAARIDRIKCDNKRGLRYRRAANLDAAMGRGFMRLHGSETMKNTSRATVYFNGDIYQIITTSQGMLNYADPEVAALILLSTAADVELGAAVRSALSKSKHTSVAEFQEIFKSGIVQKTAKDREIRLMQQYGYKTRRALMRKMACCWITADDDRIEIKPTHHKNIDGYSGISNDGPELLFIDTRISDEQLGASLREGLSRCTSAVA